MTNSALCARKLFNRVQQAKILQLYPLPLPELGVCFLKKVRVELAFGHSNRNFLLQNKPLKWVITLHERSSAFFASFPRKPRRGFLSFSPSFPSWKIRDWRPLRDGLSGGSSPSQHWLRNGTLVPTIFCDSGAWFWAEPKIWHQRLCLKRFAYCLKN